MVLAVSLPQVFVLRAEDVFGLETRAGPVTRHHRLLGQAGQKPIYITSGSFPVPVCSLELNEVTGFLARLFDFVGH